ncbi:MAG: preprotein translocase subunit SecG [Alphaproteobacteria bacterium]|nr:preprotein translocase subunit SecG [Alphaproteobacteria bacterium]
MFAVLITVQVVVCIAMIGVILLQRSEGGGLGLGTGGGVGGLMTGRGTANALTRTTVILAAIFISTSIALALVAKSTVKNNPLAPAGGNGPAPLTTLPGTQPPATPTPASPSAIPVPAEPSPSTPAPAAPAAPAPAAPTGGTNP